MYFVTSFSILLWICAALGLGLGMSQFCQRREQGLFLDLGTGINHALWGLLGIAGFSTAAILVNFVRAVDDVCSVVFLLCGLVLFLIYRTPLFVGLTRRHMLVVGGLLLYVSLIPLCPLIDYDTPLYHLQHVRWIERQQVPLGLANLHDRFGFNSSWFCFSAVVERIALKTSHPLFISDSILMFFFGLGALASLKRFLERDLRLSNMFYSFALVPWAFSVKYSANSLNSDLAAMFLVIFLFYLSLLFVERSFDCRVLAVIAVLSVFALTVKISTGPIMLLPVVATVAGLFSHSTSFSGYRWKTVLVVLIAAGVIISSWMARGVCLSGCLVYPAPIGCFSTLKWAQPEKDVQETMDSTRAWARKPGPGFRDSLEGKWVTSWVKRQYTQQKHHWFLVLLGMAVFAIGAVCNTKVRFANKDYLIPWFVATIGIIFWFWSAPELRFGYGFFYSLAILSAAVGVQAIRTSGVANYLAAPLGGFRSVIAVGIGCGLIALCMGKGVVLSGAWILVVIAAGWLLSLWEQKSSVFFFVVLASLMVHGDIATLMMEKSALADYRGFKDIRVMEKPLSHGGVVYVPQDKDCDQCWDAPRPCTPFVKPSLEMVLSPAGQVRMFFVPRDKSEKSGDEQAY